jgi:hypothetical protein
MQAAQLRGPIVALDLENLHRAACLPDYLTVSRRFNAKQP